MSSPVSKAYEAAMLASRGGRVAAELVIPPEALTGVVEIPVGCQPLGIASRLLPDGTSEIAVADYYTPAILRFRVRRDDQGLHFRRLPSLDVVTHGVERCRLFPEPALGSGVARAQTVNFDGRAIIVSPNYAKRMFRFVPDGDSWALIGAVDLPSSRHHSLHAALLGDEVLWTIEGGAAADNLFLCQYLLESGQLASVNEWALPGDFVYGIARGPNGGLLLVTDYRSNLNLGLLVATTSASVVSCRLVDVPGFDGTGNGVTVLPDGAALVTQYNIGRGVFGAPGKLVYIPAHLLL